MPRNLTSSRPAIVLALIGLTAAVVLAGLDRLTGERIAFEQQSRALAAVAGMLSGIPHDNGLLDHSADVPVEGFDRPATLYLARRDGNPVAMVIDLTTPRGYSGDIRLLIAVHMDGTVIGVHVLEHRETPGLGDRIEPRRSDWLEQFAGRSLRDPTPDGWAPDRRGGEFDTLTSATITVAAIVEAVKRALDILETVDTDLFADQSATDTATQ